MENSPKLVVLFLHVLVFNVDVVVLFGQKSDLFADLLPLLVEPEVLGVGGDVGVGDAV